MTTARTVDSFTDAAKHDFTVGVVTLMFVLFI